ncbi:MAG: thioredoxin [Methylomonas sp.]|nr:MAG: thioredoxin [Methylomonas sp.]
MRIKNSILILSLVSLVIAGAWFWQTQTMLTAPNVTFKTIKGDSIDLIDLKGRPVLVTFWATDCPGCIEEIPHLIKLHQQFSPEGLTIVAVAMDYDPPNQVLAMSTAKQLPYAVALDPSGSLAQRFGDVKLTPTSFVIDRNGLIVMQKIGVFDLADMQKRLADL